MRKTVTFAVIINALQAGMMLFLLIYLLVFRSEEGVSPLMILVIGAAVVVSLGAVLDIRDALTARSPYVACADWHVPQKACALPPLIRSNMVRVSHARAPKSQYGT